MLPPIDHSPKGTSRRRLIILTAIPLALTACDSGKTVKAENASIAEVAEAAKGVVKFAPGKWENKVSFLSAEAPGLPPQMADMMKKQMATASERTNTSCMTKDQADKPGSDIFAGKDNGNCRYERFEMGGGKIDAVMTCQGTGARTGSQPGGVRMAMAGNFTSTSYDMTSDMKMAMPGAGGATTEMTIRTKVAGKRVGDCDAPKG